MHYEEHTRHDRPYSVTLELPLKSFTYHKLKKSKETHTFSEDDMIEFCEMIAWNMLGKTITESFVKSISKEFLQLWKEQKPKIIYYE